MNHSPTLENVCAKNALPQGRDGTGRTDGIDVSADTSVKVLIRQLADELRNGNVSTGHVRRLSGGQIEIVFRLIDGSAYAAEMLRAGIHSRVNRAAEWMIEAGITNRAAFFAACAWANHSASLHHRAIVVLKRRGLIERAGREWIFKDG